ncbi:MAG TPA: response regulator transcription factor [Steroidobacteraceae bacterium]|jgi:DNA-binding NarL/FixJ family response regulator
MSNVLIADDHAMVRAGFRQFLELIPEVGLVGEASTGDETLDALRSKHWDLVLLDIHMPDRGGLDILPHIKAAFPKVPILIVTSLPERLYARHAFRGGASGFLSKTSSPEELQKAVTQLLSGRRYVSDNVAQLLLERVEEAEDALPHQLLSEREFQVLRKLGNGATVSSIAAELKLSPKTVSTYRGRVLEKLHMQNNADLAAYVMRHGLIS